MRTITILILTAMTHTLWAQASRNVSGFTQWRTGHDEETVQLAPAEGEDALEERNCKTVAHVSYKVKGYGELSFPIDPKFHDSEEAPKVDLRNSTFVRITYKATANLIVQLRQTGVHGGVHNHVWLPASKKFTTRIIYFTEFKGGKTPLDLADVAKFNFAFLGRKDETPYHAELVVKKLEIENYKP